MFLFLPTQFLKIGLVVVGGFFFTLFTTAGSIFAIRHILNDPEDSDDDHDDDDDDDDDDHGDDNVLLCEIKGESSASNEGESSSREQQPRHEIIRPQKSNTFFSKELLFGLQELLLFSGIAMLMTYKLFPNAAALSGILESLFMLLVTLHNYAVGSRLVTCITTSTQWMHPLVTCTILTWVVVAIIVAPAKEQSSFLDILRSYHRNHGDMGLGGGAGDLLLYMLGPMVISLSVPMYSKRNIVRAHVKEVATAVISASFGSLFGTALVVRYLGVNTSHRLSLISRIVTPSLAIDISNILNTNVSIAVSVVVITGLIGSTFGVAVLDFLRIQDPIVRGLCMGVSAHGLGTGSLVHEQDAFPFAAIAMALTAFLSTVIVSIPFFQQLLLKTTLGG